MRYVVKGYNGLNLMLRIHADKLLVSMLIGAALYSATLIAAI